MEKMKVLFLVSDAKRRGGTEVLALNLLERLNRAGVEAWLLSRFAYHGKNDHVLSMSNRWQKLYEFVLDFPINKLFGQYFSDWILRIQIRKIARRLNVNWIVSHTYDLVAALPTESRWNTAQVFNWSIKGYEDGLSRWAHGKQSYKRWFSRWAFVMKRARWHRTMEKLTRIVALTESGSRELVEHCPNIDRSKLVIIPDPIMVSEPAKRVSSLRNGRVAFVGRFSAEKGVMRLLRIWEIVQLKCPTVTLVLYGEGRMYAKMDEYIHAHNIQNVMFMGYESDLQKIYVNSDLVLMTSDTEGFGMVLVEAMYYGVPCVSFDCPVSPKEVIGEAGLTVPCFDETVYAETVVRLLNDKARCGEYQVAAIKQSQNYYVKKVIGKWICLFEAF